MTSRPVDSFARPWGWASAALFVVSLGYCLFKYTVTFGEVTAGPRRPHDILWNFSLFSAFALHHSVFARASVRSFVARMVPRDAERRFYVAIASVLLIAVCVWWRPIPGVAWNLEGASRWLAYAVQAAGLWLTLQSAAVLGIRELAGLAPTSSVTTAPVEFKTTGPYGWVRHPIYLAWCLMVLAAPSMTLTRLEFALVSTLYLVVAIPLEERTMAGSGDAYARYAQRVRWRMVPWVY